MIRAMDPTSRPFFPEAGVQNSKNSYSQKLRQVVDSIQKLIVRFFTFFFSCFFPKSENPAPSNPTDPSSSKTFEAALLTPDKAVIPVSPKSFQQGVAPSTLTPVSPKTSPVQILQAPVPSLPTVPPSQDAASSIPVAPVPLSPQAPVVPSLPAAPLSQDAASSIPVASVPLSPQAPAVPSLPTVPPSQDAASSVPIASVSLPQQAPVPLLQRAASTSKTLRPVVPPLNLQSVVEAVSVSEPVAIPSQNGNSPVSSSDDSTEANPAPSSEEESEESSNREEGGRRTSSTSQSSQGSSGTVVRVSSSSNSSENEKVSDDDDEKWEADFDRQLEENGFHFIPPPPVKLRAPGDPWPVRKVSPGEQWWKGEWGLYDVDQTPPEAGIFVALHGIQTLWPLIAGDETNTIEASTLQKILTEGLVAYTPGQQIRPEDILGSFEKLKRTILTIRKFERPQAPIPHYDTLPGDPEAILAAGSEPSSSNPVFNDYRQKLEQMVGVFRTTLNERGEKLLAGVFFKGSIEAPKAYAIFAHFNSKKDRYDFYLLDPYGKPKEDGGHEPISLHRFPGTQTLRTYLNEINPAPVEEVETNHFWIWPITRQN